MLLVTFFAKIANESRDVLLYIIIYIIAPPKCNIFNKIFRGSRYSPNEGTILKKSLYSSMINIQKAVDI